MADQGMMVRSLRPALSREQGTRCLLTATSKEMVMGVDDYVDKHRRARCHDRTGGQQQQQLVLRLLRNASG